MSEHRWQGYGHSELYELIHTGPGPHASEQAMRRWAELIATLDEIDQDLHGALDASASGWAGGAADQARDGLSPLRQWTAEARREADTMRLSAELQASFIAKARNDMPPPCPATAEEPSTAGRMLTHLFGGQTDYEVQERAANAAEQKAYDVMAEYEASTETNTDSLGRFSPAPQVVLDTPPGTPGHPGPGRAGPRPGRSATGRGTGTPRPAESHREPLSGAENRGRGRVTHPAGEANRATAARTGNAARSGNAAPAGSATGSAPAERSAPAAGPGRPPGARRGGVPGGRADAAAEPDPAATLFETQDVFGERRLVAPPVLGDGGYREPGGER